MSKRMRVDDSDALDHFKEFPIYGVIVKHVKDGLNKLKTQESIIQGKREGLRRLKEHVEEGTLPKSFPSMSFLSVEDEFKTDADAVIDNHLKPALDEVLHGLINIRQKELDAAVEKKAIIASEWSIELENRLQSYVAQGALDQEEKPLWSARFKDSLDKKESKQTKILNQKRVLLLEKKAKSLEKRKEREAQANVDRIMDVDNGLEGIVRELQKEVKQLRQTTKQLQGRQSLKGQTQQKKGHIREAGKSNGRKDTKRGRFREDNPKKNSGTRAGNRQDRGDEIGRRRRKSDLSEPGNGNRKPRSPSTRLTNRSGSTRNPSRPRRN